MLAVVVVALVILGACSNDSGSGGGSSDTMPPPSSCVTPCMPGSEPCLQPQEGNCSGTWYCWSDMAWHCAPPDASAPGQGGYDASAITPGDDGSDDASGEGSSQGEAGVEGGSD